MQSGPLSESLADLARADERRRDAALLRATTDLFVLDVGHNGDDLRRFEELALHFLPKVGVPDRAFVGECLARCADAPHAVVVTLARDVIAVAAPVIRHSAVLTSVDLLALIAATGADHHHAIAQRPSLPSDISYALRLAGDAETIAILDGDVSPVEGARSANPSSPPRGQPVTASDMLDPWRFLGLDRRGRLAIIADLASRPGIAPDSARPELAFRAILGAARIVGFARSGQLSAIAAAISEGLDIPRDLVAAAINDPGGELLAVMLKALRLDDVQARQVFLLASPPGKDVATFFPLSDLYSGLEPDVAEMLVAIWRDATSEARSPRHQPHFADNSTARRPAASGEARKSPPADDKAKRA